MKPQGWRRALLAFLLATAPAGAQQTGPFRIAPLGEHPEDAAPVSIRVAPTLSSVYATQDSGVLPAQAAGTPAPPQSPQPPQVPPQTAAAEAFGQAPGAGAGAEPPAAANPRMIGDWPGSFALQRLIVPSTQTISTFQTITTLTPFTTFTTTQQVVRLANGEIRIITVQVPVTIQVPITTRVPVTFQVPTTATVVRPVLAAGAGGFKIAENQSPMPEDRAFLTYNYYDTVRGPGGPFNFPRTVVRQSAEGDVPVTTTTVIPGVPTPQATLHREMFGFEKSFFDGYASVGLRLPFFQVQGDGGIGQQDLGDMTVFLNVALARDRATGSVLSAGLAVTAPTGPSVDTAEGNIHSTFLQPFIAYRWALDRLYFQGFTSVAVPTDSRDVTVLFNDVGVGYWLYRGGPGDLLSAVIPTAEVHVTTPLNNRRPTDPIVVPDLVTLTGGVQFGLTSRTMLTIGACVPVTGPRPFAVEAIAQFNFQF